MNDIKFSFEIMVTKNGVDIAHTLDLIVCINKLRTTHNDCGCHDRGMLINIETIKYEIVEFTMDNQRIVVEGAMDKVFINALLRYHDINLIDNIITYMQNHQEDYWDNDDDYYARADIEYDNRGDR